MLQKQRFLFFLLSLVFLPLVFSEARKLSLAGGWTPIANISDPHVKEVAEFAVAEYNKLSKASLKVEKVVKGETQVVSGMNYRLLFDANDGTTDKMYEAVVWEKAWENFKSLVSFNLVKA
ncbi:hypothetical protein GQ457_05G031130 [Hibiscus cannabinus]